MHRLAPLLLTAATAAQTPLAYLIDSDVDRLFELQSNGMAVAIGSTAGILTDPAGLTWRQDTRTLWTVDFAGGEVGTLNTATGSFTQVFTAVPSTGWQGIDYDPTAGVFWLIHGDFNLYRLNPGTGVTTRVGPTGAPLMTAIETDARGTLWGIGFANGVLYQLDKSTGAATAIVAVTPVNMQGLSFGPDGRLFATNSTTDSLYLINTTTGAATLTGPHGGGVRFGKGFEIVFTLAAADASGVGCPPRTAVSFCELFPPQGFDLRNGSIRMTPVNGTYRVTSGTGAFVPPVGANLALGDDAVSAPLSLGFTFPYPGGSTIAIRVCSNGFIHLAPTATNTDFSPSTAEAARGGPRLFPLWMDLNPTTGTVVFDVAGGRARVTWSNVPEFSTTSLNTFQVELDSAGNVDYRWQNAGNIAAGHSSLVGFSPGANIDPGSIDISATIPFATSLSDATPLRQLAGRPVLGQTANLSVTDFYRGAVAGVQLIGLPASGGGIDLSSLGMTACTLYLQPIAVTLPFTITGITVTIPLAVPNSLNLDRAVLGVQAAALAPGANPLGVQVSNLVTLRLGQL